MNNDTHDELSEAITPAQGFGEQLHSNLNDQPEDDEQLVPDEDFDSADAPKNAFRERLSESSDFYDHDFSRSLDPDENEHIGDQLGDENLRREAEADYK
jgi:hypothetical protein